MIYLFPKAAIKNEQAAESKGRRETPELRGSIRERIFSSFIHVGIY